MNKDNGYTEFEAAQYYAINWPVVDIELMGHYDDRDYNALADYHDIEQRGS